MAPEFDELHDRDEFDEFDEFAELYDATTLRRLERAAGPARVIAADPPSERSRPRPHPHVAAGVLIGALQGLSVAFDDEARREPIIEIAPDPGSEPVRGVRLLFVPGQPEATVAIVV